MGRQPIFPAARMPSTARSSPTQTPMPILNWGVTKPATASASPTRAKSLSVRGAPLRLSFIRFTTARVTDGMARMRKALQIFQMSARMMIMAHKRAR